jgi:hypothetical protein
MTFIWTSCSTGKQEVSEVQGAINPDELEFREMRVTAQDATNQSGFYLTGFEEMVIHVICAETQADIEKGDLSTWAGRHYDSGEQTLGTYGTSVATPIGLYCVPKLVRYIGDDNITYGLDTALSETFHDGTKYQYTDYGPLADQQVTVQLAGEIQLKSPITKGGPASSANFIITSVDQSDYDAGAEGTESYRTVTQITTDFQGMPELTLKSVTHEQSSLTENNKFEHKMTPKLEGGGSIANCAFMGGAQPGTFSVGSTGTGSSCSDNDLVNPTSWFIADLTYALHHNVGETEIADNEWTPSYLEDLVPLGNNGIGYQQIIDGNLYEEGAGEDVSRGLNLTNAVTCTSTGDNLTNQNHSSFVYLIIRSVAPMGQSKAFAVFEIKCDSVTGHRE